MKTSIKKLAAKVNSEVQPAYVVNNKKELTQYEQSVIGEALQILEAKYFVRGSALCSPDAIRTYLKLKLNHLEHEVFCALFLDTRHQVISFDEMFNGTIDGASVYPREVVKRALSRNAAAVVFVHNHPSGMPEPSQADQHITRRLQDALALIDVRVLDHFVVGDEVVSFAERGLL